MTTRYAQGGKSDHTQEFIGELAFALEDGEGPAVLTM